MKTVLTFLFVFVLIPFANGQIVTENADSSKVTISNPKDTKTIMVNQKDFIFVRVYDLHGKKINKGRIHSISDTSLCFKKKRDTIKVAVSNIGSIKTKRSAGINLLIPASLNSILMAAVTPSQPSGSFAVFYWTPVDGAIGGAISGALFGAFTTLFKNSKTYEIKGNATNWGKIIEGKKLEVNYNYW